MSTSYDSPFPRWLRMRMEKMNCSLQDLAKPCDAKVASVSHWRTGRSKPTAYHIPKLAKRLGVSEKFLRSKL